MLIPLQITHCLKLPFPVKRADAPNPQGHRHRDLNQKDKIHTAISYSSPGSKTISQHPTSVHLAQGSCVAGKLLLQHTHIQQVAKPPKIQPPPQN